MDTKASSSKVKVKAEVKEEAFDVPLPDAVPTPGGSSDAEPSPTRGRVASEVEMDEYREAWRAALEHEDDTIAQDLALKYMVEMAGPALRPCIDALLEQAAALAPRYPAKQEAISPLLFHFCTWLAWRVRVQSEVDTYRFPHAVVQDHDGLQAFLRGPKKSTEIHGFSSAQEASAFRDAHEALTTQCKLEFQIREGDPSDIYVRVQKKRRYHDSSRTMVTKSERRELNLLLESIKRLMVRHHVAAVSKTKFVQYGQRAFGPAKLKPTKAERRKSEKKKRDKLTRKERAKVGSGLTRSTGSHGTVKKEQASSSTDPDVKHTVTGRTHGQGPSAAGAASSSSSSSGTGKAIRVKRERVEVKLEPGIAVRAEKRARRQ